MELAIKSKWRKGNGQKASGIREETPPDLTGGKPGHPYVIKGIKTADQEMKDFLFSLGCYEGQTVTMISAMGEHYVIHAKDARYSIDGELAKTILIA